MSSSSTNPASSAQAQFGKAVVAAIPGTSSGQHCSRLVGPDFRSQEFLRAVEQVKQFTEEIFIAPAVVRQIEDAEIAGDYYMEVQVQGVDNAEQLIAQDQEWVRRLAMLPPGIGSCFVLTIELPRE